ncbi:MAG: hypothetical protein U9O86_03235 [Campylobacterota bacterium]|nr:hypothetical protein [Campylobacterota bacterium]
MQKTLVDIPRATLDVYNYEEDGLNVYEFDARECSAPQPMVNTQVVLQSLKNENDILRVYFFHEPVPLFEKVSQNFIYLSKELDDGEFLVEFRKKV